MYGSAIKGDLKNKTAELKGISHIMMPELKETMLANGTSKLDVTGMHWDYQRRLEKAGLYRLENIKHLEDGSYIADMWYQGICKERNTFFSSHWPLEKVLEKIEEASNNVKSFKFKWDKTLEIIGNMAQEDLQIISRINKHGVTLTHCPARNKII